ncbi:hypothetical protein MHYP_G00193250 [Metynnis hypsauchen]
MGKYQSKTMTGQTTCVHSLLAKYCEPVRCSADPSQKASSHESAAQSDRNLGESMGMGNGSYITRLAF